MSFPAGVVERRHEAGGTASAALYSSCGAYRYLLTRRWGAGPRALWIMLNPSTADETRNDPTIARCEARSREWGLGGLAIANLFAYRATRPAALKAAAAPEGPANRAVISAALREDGPVICAWGVHGAHQGAGERLAAELAAEGHALTVLGLTKGGLPRHPLYLRRTVRPEPWAPPVVLVPERRASRG
ncbi:DUF1643 domain-containing protein [Pseudoroseicyclus sp. CXY001]|uniref:DUF1643 domain-containing protein n=1 Tax=Pseudoroseicyclus sp. CXY001 TaxID=3242492 RepID=UPI003570C477